MSSTCVAIGRLSCHWWSLAAVLCSVGCGTRTTYHVELRPTAQGFVRTVEVASHPRPEPQAGKPTDQVVNEGEPAEPLISEEEQKVLSAIYGPSQRGSESERFEGRFTEHTPDDVGGSGSLIRWTSDLGDTFVYHERFRGKLPTLHDRLLRQAAIDRVIDWTLGWLDEELAGIAGGDEIKRFVEHDLRTDLQDLACLVEVTAASEQEPTSQDQYRPMLLIGHFLAERGYVSFADLGELPLDGLSEQEQQAWMLERMRRKLVKSTGLSDDAAAIQWLKDPEPLGQRFLEFLERTPEYRLWREEQLTKDAAASAEPSKFLGEALEPVVGPLFVGLLNWGGFDELTLVLHTTAEPLETNGQWDAESGRVRWQWHLPRRSTQANEANWLYSGLPHVAFAQWVQPDPTRQSALFGEVLIRDEALRDYCLWRRRLDEQQAARWQELLDQLSGIGQADRIARLIAFKNEWTEEFGTAPPIVDQMIGGLTAPGEN